MQAHENPIYQAQAILARRDHSEYEVRAKLAKKGFLPEQIDEGVNWLKSRKLLDDEAFAKRYVESTLRLKQVGPAWLILKLKEKHIAEHMIEPAVFGVLDPAKEEALAREAANRWRTSHKRKPAEVDDEYRYRNRLQRFLVSRGFSFDVVQAVLG